MWWSALASQHYFPTERKRTTQVFHQNPLKMTRTRGTFFCNWTNCSLCNDWPFCPSSQWGDGEGERERERKSDVIAPCSCCCHVTPCPIILGCCHRRRGNEMPGSCVATMWTHKCVFVRMVVCVCVCAAEWWAADSRAKSRKKKIHGRVDLNVSV